MADPTVLLLVALDGLSLVLALLVAIFFWRSHRIVPGVGYGAVAVAFALQGIGYLVVATSAFRLEGGNNVLDALRVAGPFLGAVLLASAYAARRAGRDLRVLDALAVSLLMVGSIYLLLYAVVPPRAALPDPVHYLPWLRFMETALLAAASGLVAAEVRGRRLRDYAVPFAFLLLAMERYTVALLMLYGVPDSVLPAYGWRLAGLVVLLKLAWPRGWARAAA